MTVREMTPQEVRSWLGNGLVMPGPKRPASSEAKLGSAAQKAGTVDMAEVPAAIQAARTTPTRKASPDSTNQTESDWG